MRLSETSALKQLPLSKQVPDQLQLKVGLVSEVVLPEDGDCKLGVATAEEGEVAKKRLRIKSEVIMENFAI